MRDVGPEIQPAPRSPPRLGNERQHRFGKTVGGHHPPTRVKGELTRAEPGQRRRRQRGLQTLIDQGGQRAQGRGHKRGDAIEQRDRRPAEILALAHQYEPGVGCSTCRNAHRRQRGALTRQLRPIAVIEHFVERIDPPRTQGAIRVQAQGIEIAKVERIVLNRARRRDLDDQRLLIGRGIGQRQHQTGPPRNHPRGQIAQKRAPGRAFMNALDQRQEKLAKIGGEQSHAGRGSIAEHRRQALGTDECLPLW